MDLRRILTLASVGLLGAAATIIGTPVAAAAAPAAPKGLSVTRSADDVHQIVMTWRAGDTTTDHYVVDVVAGDVETVINVPASTTRYTIDAPDACASYKMRVGAADAAGAVTNTGFTTLRSLTPSYVLGMATGREEDGTVATATWRAPAWTGYTPLTAYRVVFTRLSDGVVLADRSSTDTSVRFPGVDATRAYTISVSTVNEFGSCATAKSLLDRYRPADPTGLVVRRLADAPGVVEVVWQAPATGPAPTYYMVGYGPDKIVSKLRVDAPSRTAKLTLDPAKSWMLEVKAYNENGGSGAVTGYEPVWVATTTPAPVATTPAAPSTEPTPNPDPTVITAPAGDPAAPATETPAVEPTTTTDVVSTGPDRTPPSITATLSQPAVNGWFRAPVTIHFTCADDSGIIASCPADILTGADNAAQRVSGTAVDGAGNTATSTMTLKLDRTPPAITATVAGTPNAAGWYTSPPVIHYTCTDEVSLISTCPADTPITVDGAAQKVIGTALDKAGNTATATVVLSLDRRVPVITAAVVGDVNADGWYTVPPTVHFTCSDQLSGIATCPADQRADTDGTAQEFAGTAVDKAGNTASATVALNVDRTAPAIVATVLGEANADGWYNTAPTVHFACSDEGSGLADCPADVTVDATGAGLPVTGTAVDKAGNTATATVTVNIDRTAPAITATVVGTANADGWYNTTPTVHFACTDEGSGTANCPEDMPVTTDGAGLVIAGTTTDRAGNTASATVTLNVDRTAPAIVATVLGTANADGWYNTTPTVHFACTDEGSGIASCPADVPVSTDGAKLVIAGTTTDRAGNTATATVTVNVDRTAPAITATVLGTANADGWYNTTPTVHFACTDEGSGTTSCPEDVPVTTDGAKLVIAKSTTDRAGNTAIATVTLNVDRTAPVITPTVQGVPNGAGWFRTDPTVTFECTDAVSTVATCPAAQVVTTEGSGTRVTGVAADKAANTATAAVTVNVDRTAPVTTVIGVTDGGLYDAAKVPTVSCRTTDKGSGVAAEPAPATTVVNGKYTVSCAAAVDRAGNKGAAATVSYTVNPSIDWLRNLTHEYLDGAPAATVRTFDKALDKNNLVPYMAEVLINSTGRKPALTAKQATTLLYWALVVQLRR